MALPLKQVPEGRPPVLRPRDPETAESAEGPGAKAPAVHPQQPDALPAHPCTEAVPGSGPAAARVAALGGGV